MVSVEVHQALSSVDGLKKGKSKARESAPIQLVDDATIETTIKHSNSTVADMIITSVVSEMESDLLVLDELGYVLASRTGAELLFDMIATVY